MFFYHLIFKLGILLALHVFNSRTTSCDSRISAVLHLFLAKCEAQPSVSKMFSIYLCLFKAQSACRKCHNKSHLPMIHKEYM